MPNRNRAAIFVSDYLNRQALGKLGYQFPLEEMTVFEANYLTLIRSEFKKLEEREQKMKSQSRKR